MALALAALTFVAWPLPVGVENLPFNSGKVASILTAFSFVSVILEMLQTQSRHFFFRHGNALDNAISTRVL
jgi:hypothetical protein